MRMNISSIHHCSDDRTKRSDFIIKNKPVEIADLGFVDLPFTLSEKLYAFVFGFHQPRRRRR